MESDRIITCLAGSACGLIAATVESLRGASPLDPDGIHEFRVATKRLRSYWLLMAPVLGKSEVKPFISDLRDVARPLAAERDDFVRDGLLLELAEQAGRKTSRSILFIRDDLFGGGHVEGLTAVSDFRPGVGARVLETDAQRWRETANAAAEGVGLRLTEGFEATYARARSLGETALIIDTPQGYHAWRRWVKYTYYQYEWIRGVSPDALEPSARRLKRLGSLLGRLHDVHHLLDELDDRSVLTSSPKAFRRTRDRVLAYERELIDRVHGSTRALRREPALAAHKVLQVLRDSTRTARVPDLEFVSLADHEGDGTAAAARAADLH